MRIQGTKSALIAAMALASSAAFASPEFKSNGVMLRLSEKNGAVASMSAADGSECVMPATEAFTLQLLDGKGEPTLLKSS